MKKRMKKRLMYLTLVLALIASACGASDGETTETTSDGAAADTTLDGAAADTTLDGAAADTTLAGAAADTTLAVAAADSTDPIIIPLHNWSSQLAGAYVVGAILEEAGASVEYLTADSSAVYEAMCEGDVHLVHEVWQGAFGVPFEMQTAKGCVVDAATHEAKTQEEWWYPSYVEDVCPGLPDWKALNDCASLFKTAETGDKGRFLGGPADWLKGDEERVAGLEMDFTVVNVGSADVLWASLAAAHEKEEPIVLFNWTPNFVEALYEGSFIEFPPYTDDCKTDPAAGINPETTHDCGNPTDGYLKIGVWEGFAAKWPAAYAAVEQISFSNADIAELAKYVDIDKLSNEEAAAKWLEDNSATWKAWVG